MERHAICVQRAKPAERKSCKTSSNHIDERSRGPDWKSNYWSKKLHKYANASAHEPAACDAEQAGHVMSDSSTCKRDDCCGRNCTSSHKHRSEDRTDPSNERTADHGSHRNSDCRTTSVGNPLHDNINAHGTKCCESTKKSQREKRPLKRSFSHSHCEARKRASSQID